jgi:hypothetical protein
MREARTDSGGDIRWTSTMYMALNRLGSQVVMETAVASTESRTGALRALDVGTRMSEQRVNTSVAVNGRVATVSVERVGADSIGRSTLPIRCSDVRRFSA